MKKKNLSIFLIILMILCQISFFYQKEVKAAGINVTVVVESYDKVIVTDTTNETNGYDAVTSVLKKHGIHYSETSPKYISEINGVDKDTLVKNSQYGWLYTVVHSDGKYDNDIEVGADQYKLQDGDKLIFYYGDWSSTLSANDIELSTTKADSPLDITLWNNNIFNQDPYTAINNIKAKLDGTTVAVNGNKISLSQGLSAGKHTLYLNDFRTDGVPQVIADSFDINIGGTTDGGNGGIVTPNLYDRDNTSVAKDIDAEISSTTNYMNTHSDGWAALSLQKLGLKSSDDTYIKTSASDISKNGTAVIKDYSNTELEKLIMCLTAEGYSPYNFMNSNLVSELLNRDLSTFLINDAVYALLTYDYANINGNYKITRDKLISFIISNKLSYSENGINISGWTYTGDKINPDMTGLVINALAPYNGKSDVKSTIDGAVNSLAYLENPSGYLLDPGVGYSSESISVAILGLIANGINPENGSFAQNKGDLVSALLSFKGTDGQFKHVIDGTNNSMATEEAYRALIALKEFKATGKYNYYSSSIQSDKLQEYKLPAPAQGKVNELPKTGSNVDFSTLAILGIILLSAGTGLLYKKA